MPGAAACAAAESRIANAVQETGSSRFMEIAFLIVVANMAAPLQGDTDFGHLAAEVLRVVR